MKIRRAGWFWPLGATLVLRRIELASGLAALIILAAIGTGTISLAAGASSTPAGELKPIAWPVVSAAYGPLDPTVFPRQCVKRVADLTHGWSEANIVNRMNQECFSPRAGKRQGTSRAAPIAICGRPLSWRVPVGAGAVMGCSPG